MFLVVGLGNPGEQYAESRHNIGFMVVGRLALSCGSGSWQETDGGDLLPAADAGIDFALYKPMRYMNLSGPSVAAAMVKVGATMAELLVVHDDLDLPLGRVKLTGNRGAGGHNGVSSIIASLRSKDFFRLRVGIGRPGPGQQVSEFVLDSFSAVEKGVIEETLACCISCILLCLRSGFSAAMNVCNRTVGPGEPAAAAVSSVSDSDSFY